MKSSDQQPESRDFASQLPSPFNFYRVVLESDDLHFGLWPPDKPELTLEQAQETMFERLCQFLPPPPRTVLDVGCGLGKSAAVLAELGYDVTAIAPSKDLIDRAREVYAASGVNFVAMGFLDEIERLPRSTYDVLFFQESLQYLSPLPEVFRRVRELLASGGRVIISDETVEDLSMSDATAVHARTFVEVCMAEAGLVISHREDIGRLVGATCDHIVERFTNRRNDILKTCGVDSDESLKHFLRGWQQQQVWYRAQQMGYSIWSCRQDDFVQRRYHEHDENRILPVHYGVFFKPRSLKNWQWKFQGNPLGVLNIAVAEAPDGELAAHFAGYPVQFSSVVENLPGCPALHVGDTFTHPRYRTVGRGKTALISRIAHYFFNTFCHHRVPFVFGFNTGNVRRFGERFLAYEYLPEVQLQVMKTSALKQSLLTRWFHRALGFKAERVNVLGDEYDVFFERVAADYGFLIRRDASYLRWRYLECPDVPYFVIAVKKAGQLVAWGAFVRRDEALYWGDALLDRRYPEALLTLLDHAVQHVGAGVTAIQGWFSPNPQWFYELLSSQGFEATPEPDKIAPVFRIFDPRYSTAAFSDHLYYTMGDGDLF